MDTCGSIVDWANLVIATATLAVAVIAVCNWFADKEIQKRHLAINLVKDYVASMNELSRPTQVLVDAMCKELPETALLLAKGEAFELPKSFKPALEAALDKTLNIEGEKIQIDHLHSRRLRWQTLNYLNAVEAILSAWRSGVGDTAILREQMSYLFAENNRYLLHGFRVGTGINEGYPAIAAFELNPNAKPSIPSHPLLAAFHKWLVSPYCCEKHDPRHK